MTPHSPEPWKVVGNFAYRDDECVADCGRGGEDEAIVRANVARIVACVNALAGLSTRFLEEEYRINGGFRELDEAKRIAELKRAWACFRACEGIPDELLKSGLLKGLYEKWERENASEEMVPVPADSPLLKPHYAFKDYQ